MKVQKLLALILALSLFVTGIPVTALADETEVSPVANSETIATDKLFLDKTAELTDDGTYTINLEAYATGTPISQTITYGVPLDVVLVIDQSGSLAKKHIHDDLKNAVSAFVEELKVHGEAYGIRHRVSMAGFACGGLDEGSGMVGGGYPVANDPEDGGFYPHWLNTGLFVNGEFKNYGTVEYDKIESASEIGGKNPRLIFEFDYENDGIQDRWVTFANNCLKANVPFLDETGTHKSNPVTLADNVDELFEKYPLYRAAGVRVALTDDDYTAAWEYVADGQNGSGNINKDITRAISRIGSNGSTRISYGIKMASKLIEKAPDDHIERKTIVVVFTDGMPGHTTYEKGEAQAAVAEAKKIKEKSGVEIYSIGVYDKQTTANETQDFMSQMSSNYSSHQFSTTTSIVDTGSTMVYYNIAGEAVTTLPYFHKDENGNYWPVELYYNETTKFIKFFYKIDEQEVVLQDSSKDTYDGLYTLEHTQSTDPNADYYRYTLNAAEMKGMFKNIVTAATTATSEVTLDASSILKDVMADGFKLTGNTTITVSVVPGSVKEEYANLDPDELTEAHIDWSAPQQVLSFQYSTAEGAENTGSGDVIVNGAADQTEMTITATATKDGVITVSGFNYANPTDNHKENAQYICAGHPGSKLVVTITGVEAKSNVVTDSVTVTNKGTSGIYEAPGADADNDGVTDELLASFPIPTTYMASKVYVVDYAKTMTINPSDFKMSIGAVSADGDGYSYFNPAVTTITGAYGNVTVNEGKLTYTPTKTNWNGYDTFYIFGTTEDTVIKSAGANANGNMWAKVSVIPANNVYYEDTFVTNESTGVAGIVFGGVWEEVDEDGNANAGGNGQGENAESDESTAKDDQGNDHQGGVHGWEDTLADDKGFSDGSAHVAGINDTVGATATFTFTGTGVDIYSRTNKETGMVIAMLYEGSSTTDENGKNLVAKYTLMVDNLSASGDYYQIPTLSFFKIPAKDENGKTIKDENGKTVMTDLPYGTYTVKITVSKVGASQTGKVRFLYYLDGIRVYNPIQNLEDDSTVSGAYGEKELNANFVEIRDKLLDANSFSAEESDSAGPVFIDRITDEEGNHTDNTETYEVGVYKVFGPENEVYLSATQVVAFAVPYTEGAHYYIGMKSLTGQSAYVFTNSTDENVNAIIVGHTTDQYYEVVPHWEYDENGNPTIGVIFVHADLSNGDYIEDENGNVDYKGAILALTKLKVTGPAPKKFNFARISNSRLLEMVAEDLAPALDMDDVTSPDVGGTTPNKPNVDADQSDSDMIEDEQSTLKKLMIELLTKIFSDLRGWFKP